jgi:hypothetical protein
VRPLADDPSIAEVDLNPAIAWADGALAVDALVVLEGDPALPRDLRPAVWHRTASTSAPIEWWVPAPRR